QERGGAGARRKGVPRHKGRCGAHGHQARQPPPGDDVLAAGVGDVPARARGGRDHLPAQRGRRQLQHPLHAADQQRIARAGQHRRVAPRAEPHAGLRRPARHQAHGAEVPHDGAGHHRRLADAEGRQHALQRRADPTRGV
ncbi:hypothetical protein LTR04_006164, partial [Oleoguttula sp. CCFEE 6159]